MIAGVCDMSSENEWYCSGIVRCSGYVPDVAGVCRV